jgi:integrase
MITKCNPVEDVEWSSETDYESIVVTPPRARAILDQLRQAENTLLLLVTCTGLRCSEALGLKWQDIEPDRKLINIRRSWSMDKEGKPKSKATKAPVACITPLAEHLAAWRRESVYSRDEDWVFPSYKNKGRTPRRGSSLVKDHIRAAAVRAGVIKPGDKRPFGLHVLRHSLATSLISWGTDVKTVQGMMRYANPQTTLGIYTQTVNGNMLTDQEMMYDAVWQNAPKIVE